MGCEVEMSCGAKVESTGLGCRIFWKRTTLLMTFLGSRSVDASKTRLGNLLTASGSNTLESILFLQLVYTRVVGA